MLLNRPLLAISSLLFFSLAQADTPPASAPLTTATVLSTPAIPDKTPPAALAVAAQPSTLVVLNDASRQLQATLASLELRASRFKTDLAALNQQIAQAQLQQTQSPKKAQELALLHAEYLQTQQSLALLEEQQATLKTRALTLNQELAQVPPASSAPLAVSAPIVSYPLITTPWAPPGSAPSSSVATQPLAATTPPAVALPIAPVVAQPPLVASPAPTPTANKPAAAVVAPLPAGLMPPAKTPTPTAAATQPSAQTLTPSAATTQPAASLPENKISPIPKTTAAAPTKPAQHPVVTQKTVSIEKLERRMDGWLDDPVVMLRMGGAFIAFAILMLIFLLWPKRSRAKKADTAFLDAHSEPRDAEPLDTDYVLDEKEEEQDADLAPEYDFMGTEASIPTRLDLARGYFEMGKYAEARAALMPVFTKGDDAQQQEAEALLEQINQADTHSEI